MKNKKKIILAIILLLIVAALSQVLKQKTIPAPQQQGPADAAVIEKTPTAPSYTAPKDTQCYVGGCSGQICSDTPGAISTCEFKDAYSCYKADITTCERQSDGQCGWTQTASLSQCLNDHPVQFQ